MTASGEVILVLAATIVAGVVAGIALYLRRRRRTARAIGDRHLLTVIVGSDFLVVPRLRLATVLIAAVAIAAGILDPGLVTPTSTARGPVVLLLDVSGSMLALDARAGDVEVSRIQREREIAHALVESLPDRPIGVVAFSGSAFSLTPPTRDRRAIEMYLENLDPTIVSQSGSGLGAALRQGIGLLTAGPGAGGGSLVLLSDGDETQDREEAVAAAVLARREGVTVHVLGIGSARGAPVPALDLASGIARGFLRDDAGEIVVSRLGIELLGEIAERTQGVYATADVEGVGAVTSQFRQVPPPAPETRRLPLYAWLAAAAFLLLIMEPLTLPRTKFR